MKSARRYGDLQSLRVRGFTLLEVVVALAVLAMTLAVVYEAFGWGLRRSEVAQQKETAWLKAQSVMSTLRAQGKFQIGAFESENTERPKWRVQVRDHKAEISESSPIVTVEVVVTVPWGPKPGEFIELKSIELARRLR